MSEQESALDWGEMKVEMRAELSDVLLGFASVALKVWRRVD